MMSNNEEHILSCGHPTTADDMCADCFYEAVNLLKQFIANEETYCRMLGWEKTEACIKAEKFLANPSFRTYE